MRRTTFTIMILVLGTVVLYWPALWHGLVDFDDPEYTTGQTIAVNGQPMGIVQFGLTPGGIRWAFTTMYIANWHPLTWISYMLDVQIWHGAAFGHHLTNMLLHIANVLLAFAGLKRMSGAHWRSAMVAGLFAAHPMHVESVAWVAERKDVLSTFFGLLTIWAYLNWIRWRSPRDYAFMAGFYALSLMSKAMLVTWPCAMLLLDYWPLTRLRIAHDGSPSPAANPQSPIRNPKSINTLVLEKLPLFAMAMALCTLTWLAQRGSNQLQEGDWVPLRLAAANAVVSYVRYLGKLFWPTDLAVLYPHPSLANGATWPAWMIAGSIALLFSITVLAIVLRRTRPYFIVGWLWFLGTFVPVVGFVQIGRQAMADRYTYVPYLGLYVVIVWGFSDLTARISWRKYLWPPVMASTLIALGLVASHQINFWSDSITLFTHAINVTRDNWLMHNNLGGVLNRLAAADEQQGRHDQAAQRWKEATAHLEEALRIYPNAAWVHNHYGSALGLMGKLYEAQSQFEQAIAIDPNMAEYHDNLGIILLRRDQPEAALKEHRRALVLNPNYAPAHFNSALALMALGRTTEADVEFDEAKRLNPAGSAEYERTRAALRSPKGTGHRPVASLPAQSQP